MASQPLPVMESLEKGVINGSKCWFCDSPLGTRKGKKFCNGTCRSAHCRLGKLLSYHIDILNADLKRNGFKREVVEVKFRQ